MKRRRFIQTLAAAPALAMPATSTADAQQTGGPGGAQRPHANAPNLEISPPDAAAETMPRFFTALQFSALKRLSDILMPPLNGLPGAIDAGAPEFLDFLIGASPAERQQVYKVGLDTLNAQSRRRFGKSYADITADQAAELLAPLKRPWTYDPPADPLERFLKDARQDVRTATTNSQEYATAETPGGGRRRGGVGQYWYPID